MRDAVLILGFDEALAGLITRTLRSQQIYCEPVPSVITLTQVTARAPRGLILAAGENTKVDPSAFDLSILHAGLPVLATAPLIFGAIMDGGKYPRLWVGVAVFQVLAVFSALRVGRNAHSAHAESR